MHPTGRVAVGGGFNYAAKFTAEFGRDSGSIGLDRLHTVEIVGSRKRGGAIVEDGKSVDDVLGVVFGGTRMENSVGLKHPAWLRLDDIDRLTSRSRGRPVAQRGSAELVGVAGVRGIEQRVRIFHLDGFGDGGNG